MSKPIGFKFGKPVDDYSRTAAETELENTNEIFKLLIDAVDEYAIFALDLDGRVLTWNAGAQRLKGYAADEVVGTHFSRFYECADIKRGHPQHELEIASSQGKYEEEGWRIKKDGSRFWANVVITALRDPSGELRGYGKVTRDLTAKREAELKLRESEERFRMLVSSVTDYAVMSLDVDGRITSWNMGAQRITGYEAREILGAHVSKFYTPADLKAKKIETELKTARETGRYEEVGERVRKNGEIYWANVVINAIRDEFGEVVGFSKITRDITESKIAAEKLRESEEKLRSAYAGLEVKITERTQQLIEAKEKAEIAVKARDEFFSMASHELKTPLSALKMQTQIRQRSVKKGNLKDFATPDAILERCAEDERQVDRLTFLVDNMLDVSRLTSGNFTLSFEIVDLKELVEANLKRVGQHAHR
jgi:PAS domain S-box-containing protein